MQSSKATMSSGAQAQETPKRDEGETTLGLRDVVYIHESLECSGNAMTNTTSRQNTEHSSRTTVPPPREASKRFSIIR